MAWQSVKRSSFLTVSWRMNSITAANRRGSWRQKCALFLRPGSACLKAVPGSKTPATPIVVPPYLNSILPASPASASCILVRPTPCSLRCPKQWSRHSGLPVGISIHLSAQVVHVLCVRGRRQNKMCSSWLQR